MPLSYVDNESGMTLAEVIVALGLTSLLMVLVVSGALFVKKYVADWSDRDKITEELAFIRDELTPHLESAAQFQSFTDSVFFRSAEGTTAKYRVTDGILTKGDRPLSRAGLKVMLLPMQPNPLPEDSIADTLTLNRHIGLFSLAVAVSDKRGNVDTLRLVGRNRYESLKYRQD